MVTSDPDIVIANAGPDDSLSCDVLMVTLQASPVGDQYTYQWSGPGINITNEHLPNPVVTVDGTYTLVVTNQSTGCVSAPDEVTIVNIVTQIIAIIQSENMEFDCYITEVDLDATQSTNGPNIVYIWFDENGDIVGNSPILQVSSAGSFMFTVIDTISGCYDTASIDIRDLRVYPPVDAGSPQQIDCNNPTVILNEGAVNEWPDVIYQWTGPDGGILSPDTLLSITVGLPGEYHLMALDTALGCKNEDSVLVIDMTALPIADIGVLETFTCVDETAMLDIGSSDTGAEISYEWNGPLVNGVTGTLIEPTQPGLYHLTVINESTGCEASDSVLLEIPTPPDGLDADLKIPVCFGDASGSIMVSDVTGGTPPYLYSLNGGDQQVDPLFENLPAGTYQVEVTDANGCTYAQSFTIADGLELTIDIGPDIDLELGDSIILNANVSLPWSQIDSIVWSPGDHLSCTHCFNPVLYAIFDQVITATVYTSGCEASDQLTLRVDMDANVYIPNVFSPNGDGINDHVTVFADPRVKEVIFLEIFDRWGNQVFVGHNFQPNDPLLGWDGTFKNKPMNPAVFAYVAKVELINGVQIPLKGDITLLR